MSDDARDRLHNVAIAAFEQEGRADVDDDIRAVVDAVLSDANFNDVIRVLGGKVAGLDQRMRVAYGSSVLFKQGGDLYE